MHKGDQMYKQLEYKL